MRYFRIDCSGPGVGLCSETGETTADLIISELGYDLADGHSAADRPETAKVVLTTGSTFQLGKMAEAFSLPRERYGVDLPTG